MEGNPYESPPTLGSVIGTRSRCDPRKRLRAITLLSFYLLVAISGAMAAGRLQGGIIHLLYCILAACMATYWCVLDSRILGRPIVQSVHWLMFFTWPVAVPIYFIYSRGLRGLGLLFLHGLALVVVSTAAFYTTGYLAHGDVWLKRLGF